MPSPCWIHPLFNNCICMLFIDPLSWEWIRFSDFWLKKTTCKASGAKEVTDRYAAKPVFPTNHKLCLLVSMKLFPLPEGLMAVYIASLPPPPPWLKKKQQQQQGRLQCQTVIALFPPGCKKWRGGGNFFWQRWTQFKVLTCLLLSICLAGRSKPKCWFAACWLMFAFNFQMLATARHLKC